VNVLPPLAQCEEKILHGMHVSDNPFAALKIARFSFHLKKEGDAVFSVVTKSKPLISQRLLSISFPFSSEAVLQMQ
ncbi:MAG: hypothetical protein AAGI25_19675, partial [Bacteroidota bacterium]